MHEEAKSIEILSSHGSDGFDEDYLQLYSMWRQTKSKTNPVQIKPLKNENFEPKKSITKTETNELFKNKNLIKNLFKNSNFNNTNNGTTIYQGDNKIYDLNDRLSWIRYFLKNKISLK